MLKKPKILVVGSFMMDLIASTKRAPNSGETVVGLKFQTAPGGKGANQAVQCARLGAKVTMVGQVGDDAFGKIMRKSAAASGVDQPVEAAYHGHVARGAYLGPLVDVAYHYHVAVVRYLLPAAHRSRVDEGFGRRALRGGSRFALRVEPVGLGGAEAHAVEPYARTLVGDYPFLDETAARLDEALPYLREQRRRKDARLQIYDDFAPLEKMAAHRQKLGEAVYHLAFAHVRRDDALQRPGLSAFQLYHLPAPLFTFCGFGAAFCSVFCGSAYFSPFIKKLSILPTIGPVSEEPAFPASAIATTA